MPRLIACLIAMALLVPAMCAPAVAQRGKAPLVLAAASMQESLTRAADVFARQGHPRPILSFAASSTLAHQLAAGAPADLFVSADELWMDDLARRGLIAPRTRATLVGNRLVIVARVGGRGGVDITNRAAIARQLSRGALAMADPDTVPAGRYAKATLVGLGV
ncbi:MAG: molybdate ABC transporter substrate-binding protein, partial [Sphingomonas sp.]|nr:molybdate ABC transporter substrate-binding protein [Sphingomonas sp.]